MGECNLPHPKHPNCWAKEIRWCPQYLVCHSLVKDNPQGRDPVRDECEHLFQGEVSHKREQQVVRFTGTAIGAQGKTLINHRPEGVEKIHKKRRFVHVQ